MNNDNTQQENQFSPVVTFSNIPLDDTPAPAGLDAPDPDACASTVMVVDIQFKKGGKVYYFDPGKLTLSAGDEVIIDTARGPEYGYCSCGNHEILQTQVVSPLRPVLRVATEKDQQTRQEYKRREFEALATCQQKVAEHQLDMKLVSAEYSFDGSKILFYFTADGRVDFRDLVKDLAAIFRTRIELRQIGVRDEAKMLGGLGICGRPFCCKQFLDDFQPVSIKMAKTQSLSLNPTKISGTCGRLMCCLKYEQDAYESLLKTCPKSDSLVNTYDGVGTVTDTNLLKQTVKVRMENDPSTIKTYANDEIFVLRSGKAKKTDPPIDTNIPPLPRPEKKPESEEIAMFDETRLSNYSEPAVPPKQPGSDKPNGTEETRSSRRNSRSRSDRKPRTTDAGKTTPKQEQQEHPERHRKQTASPKPQEPKDKADSAKPKSRNRKRRYYRDKKSGGQKSE